MDTLEHFNLFTLTIIIILILLINLFYKNKNSTDTPNDFQKKVILITADFDIALSEANLKNKPIFLFAYSNLNDSNKKLKAGTFSDMNVIDFLNTNFINVFFNVDNGVGAYLAAKYKITYTPTFAFVNEKGLLIAQSHGYMIPKELIDFGKFGLEQFEKLKK